MLRLLVLYALFWMRLGYCLWGTVAYWCLRPVPIPSQLRRCIAGAIALSPYLWVVWGFTVAFDFTWRANVIAGVVTAVMLYLVYRVGAARAAR